MPFLEPALLESMVVKLEKDDLPWLTMMYRHPLLFWNAIYHHGSYSACLQFIFKSNNDEFCSSSTYNPRNTSLLSVRTELRKLVSKDEHAKLLGDLIRRDFTPRARRYSSASDPLELLTRDQVRTQPTSLVSGQYNEEDFSD